MDPLLGLNQAPSRGYLNRKTRKETNCFKISTKRLQGKKDMLELTAVAVIFSSGLSVYVHRPKFLRQDILSAWLAAVGLAEAGLVSVRRVSCDR